MDDPLFVVVGRRDRFEGWCRERNWSSYSAERSGMAIWVGCDADLYRKLLGQQRLLSFVDLGGSADKDLSQRARTTVRAHNSLIV